MERDIILIVVGGLIGIASSLITMFVIYWIEGLRLRRKWWREDQMSMRQKRSEIDAENFSSADVAALIAQMAAEEKQAQAEQDQEDRPRKSDS